MISARMGADFLMIPHESALCTIGYEYISLGSFVRHSHFEGVCTPDPMVCALVHDPTREVRRGW
jgi:hypothetical protein